MATIYKVEVVSHWRNYTKEDLEKILQDAVNKVEREEVKMDTKNNTVLSTNKLKVFIERLKKLGIEVKLSGNFPWIYLDEINGVRVTERFEANHGFTVMFLPGRNDSPPSEFTDITEIFKLIRKYCGNGE